MIKDKLETLEQKAREIRYQIKKIAMDLNFNCERMSAREMHHISLVIAGKT